MQFQTIYKYFTTFVLLEIIVLTKTQQIFDIPPSPCPHLFQYKLQGNDWIGVLELPSPPIQHHEVILHLTLSLRAATTV